MKIAHICPFYYPAIGGVRQVVEELAKRQLKEGHEVHVFTSDWDKTQRIAKQEEILDGVYVHRCKHWFRAANFMTFWPSLFPKLLKGNFDIIHSHLFAHPHFVMAAMAAKIKGIPHIHTTHCPWSDAPRSLIGRIGLVASYNLFSRLALNTTDKVIAITPWENRFINKYGGSAEKIINIPNGMDEVFFKKIRQNDFKKKNNLKNPVILFFGRLSFTKSPDKFVEIAKEILKNRPDLYFVLRGPDEGLKKKVQKMIKNEKNIILLNETRERKEIVKMYQAAEMYVLPSYREGLPLTLFEAMASGLPVVATPVNGIPYEIKEPDNGFLVNHSDTKKFAKRIIQILDDKKLKKKISENNKKRAEQYDWNVISERTLNVYKSLIKK